MFPKTGDVQCNTTSHGSIMLGVLQFNRRRFTQLKWKKGGIRATSEFEQVIKGSVVATTLKGLCFQNLAWVLVLQPRIWKTLKASMMVPGWEIWRKGDDAWSSFQERWRRVNGLPPPAKCRHRWLHSFNHIDPRIIQPRFAPEAMEICLSRISCSWFIALSLIRVPQHWNRWRQIHISLHAFTCSWIEEVAWIYRRAVNHTFLFCTLMVALWLLWGLLALNNLFSRMYIFHDTVWNRSARITHLQY